MCSILLTNRKIQDLGYINYFLRFRGPDATNWLQMHDVNFVHNLLSINGAFTTQPFVTGDVVALYNGEIYNAPGWASDGLAILPSYQHYGSRFSQHLDGEFAIAVVDFASRRLIVSTDLFGTKPLWMAVEGLEYGVSTYKTPLERMGFTNISRVEPNTILEMDLDTCTVSNLGRVYEWDLNQHKTSFDDWTRAFEQSIRKRTRNIREKIFIGLSSGYDSGAINCELNRQGVDYTAFTVLGKEDMNVVNQRPAPHRVLIEPTPDRLHVAHAYIRRCVEPYKYTICSSSSDYNEFWLDLHDDSGSNGLSMVCEQAQQMGAKIYLSGQGADELFSDYGFQGHKIYAHSNFGGLFPHNLSEIFPWNSFYKSSMESYLTKEESVSGAYGIEGRYPFLDRQVVQEFLWLTPDVKNSAYKSVLHNYLSQHNYPFVPNQKIGF